MKYKIMRLANLRKLGAYTLAELLVAVIISSIVLGGVFYLISNTIGTAAEARMQTRFLKNFYAFTGVFESGDISILNDNTGNVQDIGLVTHSGLSGGILFGVVDLSNNRLISVANAGIYRESVFAYRSISENELTALQNSTLSPYDLEFHADKTMRKFYIKNLQLESFNNGDIIDMNIEVFINYTPSYNSLEWNELSQEDIYTFLLSF